MKILLVCEHLGETDGWSRYTKNVQNGLTDTGHEVQVVSTPELPKPLRCAHNPFVLPSAAKVLRDTIEENQPDVVHITVEPYAMLVPLLPQKMQQNIVLTIHGSYGIRPLQKWPMNWFAKKYYHQISQFVSVSRYTKTVVGDALEKYSSTAAAAQFLQSCTVVQTGIVMPKGYKKRTKRQKQLVHVGGVKPRKGVLELVRACAAYRNAYKTDFRCTIVGNTHEGSAYTRAVKQKIANLNLQKHIVFSGQVSDEKLHGIYTEADAFVMPSRTNSNTFEGYGLVFIEANAYGVPCIGPDTSGAAEAIVDGKTGYHVNIEQPKDIAEKIHWIVDEKRIGAEDCKKWAAQHTVENMIKRLEKVYELLQSEG